MNNNLENLKSKQYITKNIKNKLKNTLKEIYNGISKSSRLNKNNKYSLKPLNFNKKKSVIKIKKKPKKINVYNKSVKYSIKENKNIVINLSNNNIKHSNFKLNSNNNTIITINTKNNYKYNFPKPIKKQKKKNLKLDFLKQKKLSVFKKSSIKKKLKNQSVYKKEKLILDNDLNKENILNNDNSSETIEDNSKKDLSKKIKNKRFYEIYKLYKLNNDKNTDYNSFYDNKKPVNIYENDNKNIDKFELNDSLLFKNIIFKKIRIIQINLNIDKYNSIISSIQFIYKYEDSIINGYLHGNISQRDSIKEKITLKEKDFFYKIFILFDKNIKYIKISTFKNYIFEFGKNEKDNKNGIFFLDFNLILGKKFFLKSIYLNKKFKFLQNN